MKGWLPILGPSGRGLAVIVLVAALWRVCFLLPAIWTATGIGEADRPFMDLYGLLAASDAARAGLDPYQPNALDPYHRPHVYSEWWLGLGSLGLGRADTWWLGAVLLGAVLVLAVAMARPRRGREAFALAGLLLSPALLLAVNRANNDLVVFLLIGFALLCFRGERRPVLGVGIVLLATAAVLKYSPLVALVVLLDLRTRRGLVAGLALYGLVLLLAWPGLEPGLKSATRFLPSPDWLYAFGAPVLWRNFGGITAWGWWAPAVVLVVWAALGARTAVRAPEPAERVAEREFMCGAALIVGLFFLGASYVYKLIFAVWLLPWLWRQPQAGWERRWSRGTFWLLLLVVWLEGLAALLLNLLAGAWPPGLAQGVLKGALTLSQLLTWALVGCLLRFLLGYLGRRGRALLAAPG